MLRSMLMLDTVASNLNMSKIRPFILFLDKETEILQHDPPHTCCIMDVGFGYRLLLFLSFCLFPSRKTKSKMTLAGDTSVCEALIQNL